MADLSPREWDRYAERLSHRRDVSDRWYRYYMQESDVKEQYCNKECVDTQVCRMVQGDPYLLKQCRPHYDSS